MADKVLMRRGLNLWSLNASDEDARAVLSKFKPGEEMWVTIKKARNPKFHRLYMGLLKIVFDNQDRYAQFNIFRKAVEFAAGHVEIIPSLDGEVIMQVKSIAWDELDDIEFGELFPHVMRVCVDGFLQGVDMTHLRAEVERYAA